MTAVDFPLDQALLRSAASIVGTLRDRGHAAYFVGGCVRDLVMGLTPKDVDIATSATPEEVEEIFPITVSVGAQFGVVIVICDDVQFEVATFRYDSASGDGRHPDYVRFSKTPEEDAKRRDFTVNALFYDPIENQLLDFHGGRRDIEQKIIRAIGNPRDRFQEDKLRMLRAVRFAVRWGYTIEAQTRQAIVESAAQIHQVSAERVHDELTRILTEGHSNPGILLLDDLGLLKEVLPELLPMKGVEQPPEFHPEGDVWVHTVLLLKFMDETKEVLKSERQEARGRKQEDTSELEWRSDVRGQKKPASTDVSSTSDSLKRPLTSDLWPLAPETFSPSSDTYPSPVLAWAALLHDVGKPATFERAPGRIRFNGHMEVGAKMARQMGRRLRMSNEEIDAIAELVLDHLKFKDVERMRASTLKRFVRRPYFAEHLELHRLDCLASHGNLEAYHFVRHYAKNLKPEEARPPRLVTGEDLIELGHSPGPEFKKILMALEDAQLENQIVDRESAIEFVRQKFPIH